MLALLGPILGFLGEGVKGWFERAKLERQAKTEIALRRLEIAQDRERYNAQWNLTMAEASKDSWKDEFWTMVFGLPFALFLLGVIVLSLLGYTEKAEEVRMVVMTTLQDTGRLPEWYLGIIAALVAAAIGREQLSRGAGQWRQGRERSVVSQQMRQQIQQQTQIDAGLRAKGINPYEPAPGQAVTEWKGEGSV